MPSLIKTIPGYPAHHWAYIIYTKLYHILYGIRTNGHKIYTEPYHILHITLDTTGLKLLGQGISQVDRQKKLP